MTKEKLTAAVDAAKSETRQALQDMYDALNQGQRKKIAKNETVKKHFKRYGVKHNDEKEDGRAN